MNRFEIALLMNSFFFLTLLLPVVSLLSPVSSHYAQRRVAHGQIVNGREILISEAPFNVYVTINPNKACTGVAIDVSLVLTAAHCVTSTDGGYATASSIRIYPGLTQIPDRLDIETQHVVGAVHPHPEYLGSRKAAADIALLVLAEPLRLDSRVGVTALPNETFSEDLLKEQLITVTGYGSQSHDEAPSSQYLKAAVTKCRSAAAGELQLLAADQPDGGCLGAGDSGGPAFLATPMQPYRLCGIASRGPDTCDEPAIFVSLLDHTVRDWLRSVCSNSSQTNDTVEWADRCVRALPPIVFSPLGAEDEEDSVGTFGLTNSTWWALTIAVVSTFVLVMAGCFCVRLCSHYRRAVLPPLPPMRGARGRAPGAPVIVNRRAVAPPLQVGMAFPSPPEGYQYALPSGMYLEGSEGRVRPRLSPVGVSSSLQSRPVHAGYAVGGAPTGSLQAAVPVPMNKYCVLCGRPGHATEEHQCDICAAVGEHRGRECPLLRNL